MVLAYKNQYQGTWFVCPMTKSGFSQKCTQEILDCVHKIFPINAIFTWFIVKHLQKQTTKFYIPRANILNFIKFQTKYNLRFLSISLR